MPHNTRILVVEDEGDTAATLRVVLECEGYQARIAVDGQSALEAFDDFHPHVVLADIGLPKMNGYELIRKLRSLPGGGAVLIGVVSGFGSADDKTHSVEA